MGNEQQEATQVNRLLAHDLEAHEEIQELRTQLAVLAREVKSIAATLALDEEALDRIIDWLPDISSKQEAT